MKTKINKIGRRGKIGLLALLVAVMLIGMASAALVPYLSNEVEAEITVSSPMKVGISLGKESWATTYCWRDDIGEMVLSFPEGVDEYGEPIHDWDETDWKDSITIGTIEDPIRGGETITIYTMSANLANVKITGHEKIILSNSGITCGDFKLITSRFDSIYGDLGYGRLHTDIPSDDCHQVTYNSIELWSADDNSTWDVGETDVAMWHITFKENAVGTYTITYQVVPELELPPGK